MGDTLTLTPDRKIIFQPFRGDVLPPSAGLTQKAPRRNTAWGFFWWSCALNIRTRDSERIVPRNVESQYELTSFVPIIVHINRVDKRVDDTPLILNIFYITPLERFEPIHDSLLRQEGLFHFLPGNLPFEVSAFFFQPLKTFLRCWCDNALLYCRHEVLDSLIGLLQSFL